MDWKLSTIDDEEMIYVGVVAIMIWLPFMIVKWAMGYGLDPLVDVLSLGLTGYLFGLFVARNKQKQFNAHMLEYVNEISDNFDAIFKSPKCEEE